MRILIAPLEFKGTLTAHQVTAAIERGIRRARPGWELDCMPMADGGPGTVEVVLAALGGSRKISEVRDPLGRPHPATWAIVPRAPEGESPLGVIEMAAASGLALLDPQERDPRRASTYGTGQLLLAAAAAGCRQIVLGVGGSATNDGGAGALSALGARFLDVEGRPLPEGGAALARLRAVDLSTLDPRLRGVPVLIATDVVAPLLGPTGATRVFGPQKGADPAAVEELEAALARYASLLGNAAGRDLRELPGAGAAGGLAYGLATALGAALVRGFDFVADLCGIERRLDAADLVISGEGRMDAQTRMGKGPWRIFERAKARGIPVVVLAGSVAPAARLLTGGFEEVIAVTPPDLPEGELRARAAELVEAAAESWALRRSA